MPCAARRQPARLRGVWPPGPRIVVAVERPGIYYTNTIVWKRCLMKDRKTVSVSYRVSPRFKRALQLAAESVNRTQTNFLETLVFDYCGRHGIVVEADNSSYDRSQGVGE